MAEKSWHWTLQVSQENIVTKIEKIWMNLDFIFSELPLGDTIDSNLQPYEYSNNYGNLNDESLMSKRGE